MEAEKSSFTCPQLCRQFSLDEILLATQNFDEALVVGEGGFGKVYKATINVDNGANFIVAIKRLDSGSNQGAPEFCAEIEMLSKLRHCNLVSLIGYCNENSEMILIYDFMPNGTLDGHLHRYGTDLSWVQRLKISIGAARGLHYLHTGIGTQHGVIHRDVKSSNILLDKDYAAKISDFGLSKIGPTNTSAAYVNTLVKGTFGYLDPEYFLTGRLTRKSDVFAFGVVLFELLCRRVALDRNLDDDKCSLAKWAHESIEEGKVYEITDSNIKSQICPKCLKLFVQIADRCLSSESKKRPTMAEILVALELCLTLQNKFDRRVKSAAGILPFARMIKWPFVSSDVKYAKSKSDNHLEASSAQKLQILLDHNYLKFSFDDLKNATRDFTHDYRLGGGEFGEVFEGWIRISTGILKIAIRRFHHSKIQHHLKEKILDMRFLTRFYHPNVVKVLGYCFEDKQLFLIYEFIRNGSLDSHLFIKDKKPLTWNRRIKIIVGIAEALLFLHITLDLVDKRPIRLEHILLDEDFNARISDFEAAILTDEGLHNAMSCDPSYYHPSRIAKYNSEYGSNIYAFGVVLVQILTGERDSKTGIEILRCTSNLEGKSCIDQSLMGALDPRLPNVDDAPIASVQELVGVAFQCLDDPSYTLNSALAVLRQL